MQTKPPSGQGLTLTLKGLCLAPAIATPQAGYVVSISTSTPQCLWNHNVWSELLQTPSVPRANVALVCVCALWFVFCVQNWETTTVSPTILREAEQLCLWRRLFVVFGRQEMRSCWGLRLCAYTAYRRAGPGHGENTNHLLAGLTKLMEMRKSSFSAMYQSKVESVVRLDTAIPPLPLTHLIPTLP